MARLRTPGCSDNVLDRLVHWTMRVGGVSSNPFQYAFPPLSDATRSAGPRRRFTSVPAPGKTARHLATSPPIPHPKSHRTLVNYCCEIRIDPFSLTFSCLFRPCVCKRTEDISRPVYLERMKLMPHRAHFHDDAHGR